MKNFERLNKNEMKMVVGGVEFENLGDKKCGDTCAGDAQCPNDCFLCVGGGSMGEGNTCKSSRPDEIV
jgi:hypothetical protein